jgi:hypothetical protein
LAAGLSAEAAPAKMGFQQESRERPDILQFLTGFIANCQPAFWFRRQCFGLNFLAFGEGSFAKGIFRLSVKDRTN